MFVSSIVILIIQLFLWIDHCAVCLTCVPYLYHHETMICSIPTIKIFLAILNILLGIGLLSKWKRWAVTIIIISGMMLLFDAYLLFRISRDENFQDDSPTGIIMCPCGFSIHVDSN